MRREYSAEGILDRCGGDIARMQNPRRARVCDTLRALIERSDWDRASAEALVVRALERELVGQ